jgi:aminopeptidase N
MKSHSVSGLVGAARASTAFVLAVLAGQFLAAQRLPATVIPTHYTLSLRPDLKTAKFSGSEKIGIGIKEPVQSITLNAAEIVFQSVTVHQNRLNQTGTVSLDEAKQQATLTFPKTLEIGSATLSIEYTGILNQDLRGFYLSKTPRRNYAVTQFEPTDARRAFPCFDEPAFKAVFDVSLVVDTHDTAISNGGIVSDTPGPGPGHHTIRFSPTPKMSTYLVAFLVGDFKCISGQSDQVKIGVCATPDQVDRTAYALEVAKFALHYYDDYFGIAYPLKKLDLIAIPDFEAGAMENFGAITFRETDLLVDPKTISFRSQENVTLDITHEMAHQWFGDLVTMQWWDNIWLNEGFATWMENKCTAAMHKAWDIPQLVAADEQATLDQDAQPTTRAIRARADTPDEINQMFDEITYTKAGDVLLTVENYLGAETFRRGVQAYLQAHLYGNATSQDFWNAQTQVSGKPVDKIMESLVAQPGEPILSFGEPANGEVEVHQARFFLDARSDRGTGQQWTLPVCFKSSSGEDCQLMTPARTSFKVPGAALFFANAEGKGYYRSAYAPASYARLVSKIETGLNPVERISLTGDEWARVRADQAPVGDYLKLVTAISQDDNADVLASALANLATVFERLATTDRQRAQLSAWIDQTFVPILDRLGPPKASEGNTTRVRAELVRIVGSYGDSAPVVSMARQTADRYLADPASVDPTFAQAALAVAARNGDEEFFHRLESVYETSDNPQLKNEALRLLADFRSPDLVKRALDYAMSSKVRNQDAGLQFAIPLADQATRDVAWEYMKANWSKVHAQLTTSLGAYLVAYTGYFCSPAARDDVQQFFATHEVAAADVSLRHALQQINGCIDFRAQQGRNLEHWLDAQPGL